MRIDQFMSGAAVDGLTDALLLVGFDGSILDANEAALDYYRCSREQMLALNSRDIGPFPAPADAEGSAPAATLHGAAHESEHRRCDGSCFPVEVRAVRVNADGQSALLFSVRDTTERKRLEAVQQRMMTAVIDVIGSVSESRDPYTAGHQRRVTELATALAEEMRMSDEDVADVRLAGLMHDIGKVVVPAEILSLAGQLSSIEFEVVKDHAEAGYQILSSAHLEGPIVELVHQHHERCDGSGYPRGLRADELLPGAKILAVADVVEAMCSPRPHRPAPGIRLALAEIEGGSGRTYDADVVEACTSLFRDKGFAFSEA